MRSNFLVSYYAERILSTRKYISSKIFEQHSEDIFLFTGIDWNELSILVKSNLVGTSSDQLEQTVVSVHFMTMDQPIHFEKVVEKSSNPVHLINYENGRLEWMKSKRSLKTLQRFLDKFQDELREEEFLLKLNSDLHQTVIISDGPGMGKSVLLGKIGKRLEKRYPEQTVFLLVLREFIINFKGSKSDELTTKIKMVLQSMLCDNAVGKAVLTYKLNSATISIDLLLDGFDQLYSSRFKLAYEVLKAISSIKSIRLWVTSTPHLLEELENNLNVLGHTINPFEETHQIQVLSSYWSRNQKPDQTKFENFARECLKILKIKVDSNNHEIAGMPLKCFLLGQAFKEEAIAYANLKEKSLHPILNPVTNITELYKSLIDKKMDKYIGVHARENFQRQKKRLMEMHGLLSLALVFPEYVKKLDGYLTTVELEQLIKMGLVNRSARFRHRTFLEYFLAFFVLDKLATENSWNETMTELLFERILHCKIDSEGFKHHKKFHDGHYKSIDDENKDAGEKIIFGFSYPAIAYFLNELVIDLQLVPSLTSHSLFKKSALSATTGMKIIHACARHNFANILKTLVGTKLFEEHSKTIFSKKCVLLSIDHGEVELVQLVLERFEQHHKWELEVKTQAEMLHRAIKGGKFSVVKLLIRKKVFHDLVVHFKRLECSDGFLHACVEDTSNKTASEMEERVQILRLLTWINQNLLEERNKFDETPLLLDKVHLELRTELVRLGANVLAHDMGKENILHASKEMSSKDYHTLLISLSNESLRELVHMEDLYGVTPLRKVVRSFDPLPETLTIFKNAGADFDAWNSGEHSAVLDVAVTSNKSADTLRALIKYGSGVRRIIDDDPSLLHIAAENGNVEAVAVFLEENLFNINRFDWNGNTPLHYGLKDVRIRKKSSGEYFRISKLLP